MIEELKSAILDQLDQQGSEPFFAVEVVGQALRARKAELAIADTKLVAACLRYAVDWEISGLRCGFPETANPPWSPEEEPPLVGHYALTLADELERFTVDELVTALLTRHPELLEHRFSLIADGLSVWLDQLLERATGISRFDAWDDNNQAELEQNASRLSLPIAGLSTFIYWREDLEDRASPLCWRRLYGSAASDMKRFQESMDRTIAEREEISQMFQTLAQVLETTGAKNLKELHQREIDGTI
jgi:hypothetical protein